MATSFLTKARDEGLREGRKEGRKQSVLDLTRARFGRVPRAISQRVKSATDEDELSRLMGRIAVAESPSELDIDE